MIPKKQNTKIVNVEEKTFKFSWVQMFSNANGKTSATALVGFLSAMVCLILFCILVMFYFFNITEATTVMSIIDKTITYFSISAGLLGVRSISSTLANGDRIKIGGNKDDNDEKEEIYNYKPQNYPSQYHYGPSYGTPQETENAKYVNNENTNDATTGLLEDDMRTPDED